VTADDVQTLERIYAEWAKGNFWSFDSFDPEVETVWATEVPDLQGSTGIEGLAQLLRDWLQAWESCRIEAEEFHDAGDRVVVFVRLYARGSGSSIDVEMPNAHVWTMRAGRALAIRAYTDRERALRAVGLAPE
jgi:ketosteroid isomerase-like protein